MDELSAFEQIHPEAIYLHDGETYFVSDLETDKKVAYVEKADVDYFTQSITETRVKVESEDEKRQFHEANVAFGDVTVTSLVFMFKKIKFHSRDSIGFGKITLPPQVMDTAALWLIPPLSALNLVRKWGRDPSEGLYGIGNVITEVVPLYAMCDPRDVGAVVDSLNTGSPTLFVYDRYPGGIGFAERTYRVLEDVLEACLQLVMACECEDGCPSCVGAPVPPFAQNDPDTSPRGRIPDKEAALILLHSLLDKEPYTPKPVKIPHCLSTSAEWDGESGGCDALCTKEPGLRGALDPQGSLDEVVELPMKRLPESVEARLRRQLARLSRQ